MRSLRFNKEKKMSTEKERWWKIGKRPWGLERHSSEQKGHDFLLLFYVTEVDISTLIGL